jgi:hypothetical protein
LAYFPPVNMIQRYWDTGLKWIKKLSYIFSVLGVSFDQYSTRLGLQHPLIYESNPVVRSLIEAGVWLYADILILGAILMICKLLVDRWSFPYRGVVFLGPLTYGLLRFFTGYSNMMLLISVMNYPALPAF